MNTSANYSYNPSTEGTTFNNSSSQIIDTSLNEHTTDADSYLGDSTDDSELFEFYCPTCLMSFPDEQSYRAHYKSDLHLYNVKRKLVGLKPTTQEMFDARKLPQFPQISQKIKKQFFNFFDFSEFFKSLRKQESLRSVLPI